MWVSVGAVAVLLLALALVFREQPPYEFLRGATHVETEIPVNARSGEVAVDVYTTNMAVEEVCDEAWAELAPHGWEVTGMSTFASRQLHRGTVTISIYTRDYFTAEKHHYGRTVIVVYRPPRLADQCNAWLDRVTGR